jgi:hypothetical protein
MGQQEWKSQQEDGDYCSDSWQERAYPFQ